MPEAVKKAQRAIIAEQGDLEYHEIGGRSLVVNILNGLNTILPQEPSVPVLAQ